MKIISPASPLLSRQKLHRLVAALFLPAITLITIGCGALEPTPSPGQPTPTEDVQATIAALAGGSQAGASTPTPVPPEVRQAAVDFANSHRRVVQDWETLYRDFDSWRQGLINCDASAVQVALGQFAGRFGGVADSARELPRSPMMRELADQLIAATEREEDALNLLRATWQPGEPVAFGQIGAPPVGLAQEENEDPGAAENPHQASEGTAFQRVHSVRSEASAVTKEIDDKLRDLQESTTPESRALITDFAEAFASLNASWDGFHRNYDSFRSKGLGLTPSQELAELGALIDEFRGITIAIRQLPVSHLTRPIYQALAEAAEAEDLALRRVRSALQGTSPASTQGPAAAPELSYAPQPAWGTTGSWRVILAAQDGPEQPPPGQMSPFDSFDAQLVKSNAIRRQAQQDLDNILEIGTDSGRRTLEEFMAQYDAFRQELDTFHQDYDEWLRTEGGCPRQEAVEALGRFSIRSGELASRVRALPGAAPLQPMAETLVEAAAREEEALRTLRNNWRPFDASIYQPVEQERSRARRLRRQVDVGLHEILDRYGISPQELEQ